MKRIIIAYAFLAVLAQPLVSVTGRCLDSGAVIQDSSEDKTREAFIFSRERLSAKETKGTAARRKKRVSNVEKAESGGQKAAGQGKSKPEGNTAIDTLFAPKDQGNDPKATPVAGYTIFKQTVGGDWTACDASASFRRGDILRFVVETAQDGYLYVFNTTNGSTPQMVYPHPGLNRGANRIPAHVPYEIPSRDNPDFSGFELADAGVNEDVWVIISRTPLPAVPTSSNLLTLCSKQKAECLWEPTAGIWNNLVAYEKSTITVESRPTETASLSGALGKAITRHVRLKSRSKGTEPAYIFRGQEGVQEPLAVKISLAVR